MSFLTEAAATLEYDTGYNDYSLPHSKTVDLIGEEFIKKEGSQIISVQSTESKMNLGGVSLPPLTYTTTTIPTISTQVSASEEAGVLYCNLDDLSRYIPDNFSFDQLENIGTDENVSVQVLSLPGQVQQTHKQMAISFPTSDQRMHPGSSTVQIQVKICQLNILVSSESCVVSCGEQFKMYFNKCQILTFPEENILSTVALKIPASQSPLQFISPPREPKHYSCGFLNGKTVYTGRGRSCCTLKTIK